MGEKLGGSNFNCDRCVCPSCEHYKRGKCEAMYNEILDEYMGRCPGDDGSVECFGYEECLVDKEWREWKERMER